MATRAIIEFKEDVYADHGGKLGMTNDGNPETVARLLKVAMGTREKVRRGSFRHALSLHFITADVLEMAALGYAGRCVPLRDAVVDIDPSHHFIIDLGAGTVTMDGEDLKMPTFLALAAN